MSGTMLGTMDRAVDKPEIPALIELTLILTTQLKHGKLKLLNL